ncbi:MAG: Ku protein, partial [Acidimicrobiia bacterium]
IQDSVDLIQEAKVVEQLQVKVDVDQLQERVEVLREQLETALHNWREQFTPGVAGPRPVKIDVEAETQKPKPTTAKKATPKKATPKATAKSTAKRTAPKSTAKKTAPKKTAPKKTSTEE